MKSQGNTKDMSATCRPDTGTISRTARSDSGSMSTISGDSASEESIPYAQLEDSYFKEGSTNIIKVEDMYKMKSFDEIDGVPIQMPEDMSLCVGYGSCCFRHCRKKKGCCMEVLVISGWRIPLSLFCGLAGCLGTQVPHLCTLGLKRKPMMPWIDSLPINLSKLWWIR